MRRTTSHACSTSAVRHRNTLCTRHTEHSLYTQPCELYTSTHVNMCKQQSRKHHTHCPRVLYRMHGRITIFPKLFSCLPRGTYFLPVSDMYQSFDEMYHLFALKSRRIRLTWYIPSLKVRYETHHMHIRGCHPTLPSIANRLTSLPTSVPHMHTTIQWATHQFPLCWYPRSFAMTTGILFRVRSSGYQYA